MDMTEKIDWTALEQRLRHHVGTLAAVPRPPGSAAHRQAQDHIRLHLKRAGFAVLEDPYSTTGALPGLNLLTAPVPNRPDLPLVIMGAHYDSLPQTPGADDNASAVAALLELAAWLAPRLADAGSWTARLQLAAYDQEEEGLVGSRWHCSRTAGPLRGMISLEMLGYTDRRPGGQRLPPQLAGLYPDVGDFIGVVGNQMSAGLAGEVTQSLRRVEGLPVEMLVVPGNGEVLPDTRRSDHASFWDRGHPALMVTDTSFLRNPHYHQPSDTPDTLDYPFLARVTAAVCLAVADLLGVIRPPE
jgi:Zn-dependent M28 family amino/carboxypeptidase